MIGSVCKWVLSILATLSLCACGSEGKPSSNSPGGAAGQKVFNYVNIAEPKRLDPAFIYDVYEGIASGILFDGLVNYGKGIDVEPGLAEKWEISPDAKTYTFHLRDAKFSNGKQVTSSDVRYSFTRILRPETNSARKWLFNTIVGAQEVTSGTAREVSGIQTPDEKTVIIQLKKSTPAFLTKLAMANGAIIPEGSGNKSDADRKFDQNPTGTGPFKFHKRVPDQRVEFHRNENYWGEKPKLDSWIYNVIVEDSIQRQQFNIGGIDLYGIGFSAFPQYSRDPRYKDRMIPQEELNIYFVGMGNSHPKLRDKRVRQAIAHGMDTKTIFDRIQLGRGVWAHGPVPPGIQGFRPDIKPREYNPEKSKQLLAEAGVKDLSLRFWFTQEPQNAEFASEIRASLERAGVKVELVPRDNASVRSAMYAGEPDLYLWSWWMDYPDIENALIPCFHSRNIPRGGNGSHFRNAAFDELVDRAESEPDSAKRISLFQQAEDIIIDECPWVFLFHRKSYILVQPWVKNLKMESMYNAGRYTDVDIDLEQRHKR